MLSTRHITTSITDVNPIWVFENYLKIQERLVGQEVVILSPLSQERTPSFTVFCEKSKYFYKDFSSNKGGNHINLVQELFKITKGQAINKIIQDYNSFLKGNGMPAEREIKHHEKFRVDKFEMRKWNQNDKAYWSPFHIRAKTLEHFNAAPLAYFEMSKMENGEEKRRKITRDLCYGYFTKTGELYRIYQPANKACKFIKVFSYVQGEDQLTGKSDNLLIQKSLKDCAAFFELQIPGWEVIAPDSENNLLPAEYIKEKRIKYKHIVSFFDCDKAGYAATEKYEEIYSIPPVGFNMGQKDLSDSMKHHGIEPAREELMQLLNNVCTKD